MAYLTLAEGEDYLSSYLGYTLGSDPAFVLALIDAVSNAIDRYTHRTFQGSQSNRLFDAVADVEGRTLWVYQEGDLAPTSASIEIINGNSASIASGDFVTEPRNAFARAVPIIGFKIKDAAATYWRYTTTPEDSIIVRGVWAYSATPPADVIQAAKIMLGVFWSQKGAENIQSIRMDDVSVTYANQVDARYGPLLLGLLEPLVREF